MNRRKMMKGSVVLGAGMIAGNMFAEEQKMKGLENFIFINLKGGPSQLELFDGKPRSYNSGPTRHIKSKIPGVYFNKTMPGLQEFSNNMAVFRMTSPEKDHKRGQYYLQSGGNRPLSTLKHPGISSVIGWNKGRNPKLPGAIAMGGFQGSGYLGITHSPFGIENLEKTRDLLDRASSRRLTRVADLQKQFQQLSPYKSHQAMKDGVALSARAIELSSNSEFKDALGDSGDENEYCPDMERSGSVITNVLPSDPFGYNQDSSESFLASCGVAVEMLKIGVPAVQVELSGWDTHKDNFSVHQGLTTVLDQGMLQLITGLKQAGKFDSTLIYISGEFGRTPKINRDEGREDYSDIFSSALISGAFKKGKVFGETSKDGQKIKNAVTVSQLSASILKMMDIDPVQKIHQGLPLLPFKRDFLKII